MGYARSLRRFERRHAVLLAACKPLTPDDKAFYAVRFETSGDYPHNDRLVAVVSGRHAERWADAAGYIDGDTWDACGSDARPEVYAIVDNVTHVGGAKAGVDPIDRWRAEGYALDLSGHRVFEPSCDACECDDPECPFRVHWDRGDEAACGFTDHGELPDRREVTRVSD